ncbi:O-antigen ligase [Clostridium algifaecis]|uniref:O-antigen ligase n=1 Tax=Clostridium algifaecis TaxID=1472040 RepID=A0ABS4KQZ4_9CLOT|nr:O-antigen ligase family protein [Clostridium algifaecis]MBP2032460.1 O-antigen ligase [Clostridium algifaecis]
MKNRNSLFCYLIVMYMLLLVLFQSKYVFKGIPINGDAVLGIIIVIYLISILINKNVRSNFIYGIRDFFKDYLNIFISLWILILFVSISYAKDKGLAAGESVRFLSYVVLYFIIVYEINNLKLFQKLIKVYLLLSSLVGIIGIFDFISGIGTIQKNGLTSELRVASTLENSNNLGAFFVFAIFPMIILLFKEKIKFNKLLYLIGTIICFLNIVFSGSRNAWVGLIVGIFILTISYSIKFISVFGVLGVLAFVIPQVGNRIRQIFDASQNESRVRLWKIALLMIKDKPVLGVGSGNYRAMYDTYQAKVPEMGYGAYDKFHPHNVYLKSQCELGILGSVSIIGIIISSILKSKKVSKIYKENNFISGFYEGAYVSFSAFAFMNFIDNFFSAPKVIAFFWIVLGIGQALIKYRKREYEEI